MNDFTKEELTALYLCLNPVRIKPNICYELKDKIQSMIDNYCEHRVLEVGVKAYKCMACDLCILDAPNNE